MLVFVVYIILHIFVFIFNKRLKLITDMGIPRFYKWYVHHLFRLRSRYPQIRLDLTDSNKQVPIIDNLYLDFNGIIYRCLSVNLMLFRIMNAF